MIGNPNANLVSFHGSAPSPTARPFRFATSHFHAAHSTPLWVGHEMLYFYDEGLTSYEFMWEGILPIYAEKPFLARWMWERGLHVVLDVRPNAVFALNGQGEETYVIGCWRAQGAWNGVGAPHVKSLLDLKGRTIGVLAFGGIDHELWCVQLRRAGLNPETDVRWKDLIHEMGDGGKALLSGEVDAILVMLGEDRELEKQGYNILFETAKLYPHGRPDRVTVATGQALRERREEVKAFLRGLIRSYWFCRNPRNYEYLAVVDRRLRLMCGSEAERALYSAPGAPWHAAFREGAGAWQPFPMDGLPSLEGLQAMLDEQKEIDAVKSDYRLESCLQLDLVKEAFAELASRPELKPEIERMKQVKAEYGY